MEMPWDDVDHYMAEAGERRRKEIDAMNSAPPKRKPN
jgi:hypothetical protein